MIKNQAEVIRMIVRDTEGGASQRELSRMYQIGKGTVGRILDKAKVNDVTSMELGKMTDDEVINTFYPSRQNARRDKKVPDFKEIHDRICMTKHRSMYHEWTDYRKANPEGYSYSRFMELYVEWCHNFKVRPVMLDNEIPGRCVYVDWAGDTVTVQLDGYTKPQTIYFFVTSCGASELPYVEPFLNTKEESYIDGTVHALRFYGAVPERLVPDNCKTAIENNDIYEFTPNSAYAEMAGYYDCKIIPARPVSPTDKNDVEANVYRSEDWIISDVEVHKKEFRTFEEIKDFCAIKLDEMNLKNFKKTKFNRLDWFRNTDLPHMRPLKVKDFVLKSRYTVTVPSNYHVQLKDDPHQYSVPYQYIGQEVEILYDEHTLDVYKANRKPKDKPIVSWERSHSDGLDLIHTIPAHRPASHQFAVELKEHTSYWYLNEAKKIGPHTYTVIQEMLTSKSTPDEMFRSCLSLLYLVKPDGKRHATVSELESACKQALEMNSVHFTTIYNNIKMCRSEKKEETKKESLPEHENIRPGNTYE